MAIEAVERLPDISPFSRLNTPFLKPEIFSKSELRIGSLENKENLQEAIKMIENEQVVAVQMRGIFGLFARGDSDKALNKIHEIKGETDKMKPFSSMMFSKDFVHLIDLEAVSSPFKDLLKDGFKLQKIIGTMCHLRAPIKPSLLSKIPKRMLTFNEEDSKYYMHNLDPFGHRLMSRLIKGANERGIKYVAVTSLNDHSAKEPEITQFSRAKEFCHQRNVKLLLTDPSPKREEIKGSFAILDISKLSMVRDGHVPVEIIETLLQTEFDKNKMKEPAYSQSIYPSFLSDSELPPELKRIFTIFHIEGLDADKVRNRLERVKRRLAGRTGGCFKKLN